VSWQARLVSAFLKRIVRPRLNRERDPVAARARFLRIARLVFRDPRGAQFQPDRLEVEGRSLPALGVRIAGQHGSGIVLYFHGGAYLMGSPRTHRALAARLAKEAGVTAILPHYRRAPELPFPAAFDDAVAAYVALLARGHAPEAIAIAGDSAGGGLALALLAEIGRLGLPRPAAALAFSPLADMSFSGASIATNAERDVMLPASRAEDMRRFYMPAGDPRDPRASPLFAHWQGPPPVMLMVSDTEILRDDSLRMAEVLRKAGGTVRCDIWDDLPHVWPIFQGWMPEADEALRQAGAFLRAALPKEAGSGVTDEG